MEWIWIFVICSVFQGVELTQPSGFIGCYTHSTDYYTKHYHDRYNNNGENCKKFCFQRDIQKYAGTSTKICYCYGNLSIGTKLDVKECESKCPNQTEEICGGVNKVSMYKHDNERHDTTSATTTTTAPSSHHPPITNPPRTSESATTLPATMTSPEVNSSSTLPPTTMPTAEISLETSESVQTQSTLGPTSDDTSVPISFVSTQLKRQSTSTFEPTKGNEVLGKTELSDVNPVLHYVIPSVVAVVLLIVIIVAALLFWHYKNKRREKQIIVREDHHNEDEISRRRASSEAEYAVIEEKPNDPDYDSTTYRPKQQPATVTGNEYGQLNMLKDNSAKEQNTESEYDTTTWRPKQPTVCTENDYGQLNMSSVNVAGQNEKEAESDYDTTIRRPNQTHRGVENEYGHLNMSVSQTIGACIDVEGDYSHIGEERNKLRSTDKVDILQLTKELKVADATLPSGTSSRDSTYDTLKYNVSSV